MMMKRNFFLIVLMMVLSVSAFSQKSKKQKGGSTESAGENPKAVEKEWAKKLKLLKPLDYKALVEEKEKLQQELATSSSQAAQCRDQISSLQSENDRLKQEMEELNAKVIQSNTAANANGGSSTAQPGVVYKVQIGAFRNKDLTKYFNNNKNFSGDVDADGTKKYTLGVFTEYWEADNFKKYLREMGVKDAWVVAYKDGQRVPIKDVLESAGK